MATSKEQLYAGAEARLHALCAGESDPVALMATAACELHHSMPHFHWTGFYRVVAPRLMKIGPYQGGHGCLVIPFERGVCGACARSEKLLRVDNVDEFPGHIACSSTTRSEIVLPVHAAGQLVAVLDVDSNLPAAFDSTDEAALVRICHYIGDLWQS